MRLLTKRRQLIQEINLYLGWDILYNVKPDPILRNTIALLMKYKTSIKSFKIHDDFIRIHWGNGLNSYVSLMVKHITFPKDIKKSRRLNKHEFKTQLALNKYGEIKDACT